MKKIHCPACNNQIKEKPQQISVNYSPLFLHNEVMISNAKKYNCEACSAQFTDLGDSDQIDLQIATRLLESDADLTRSHLRWLRVCVFKMNPLELAKLLNCNAVYITEVEQYKRVMSPGLSSILKLKLKDHLLSKRLLINASGRRIKITVN
jgi:C4-type Zn-finger protein